MTTTRFVRAFCLTAICAAFTGCATTPPPEPAAPNYIAPKAALKALWEVKLPPNGQTVIVFSDDDSLLSPSAGKYQGWHAQSKRDVLVIQTNNPTTNELTTCPNPPVYVDGNRMSVIPDAYYKHRLGGHGCRLFVDMPLELYGRR